MKNQSTNFSFVPSRDTTRKFSWKESFVGIGAPSSTRRERKSLKGKILGFFILDSVKTAF